MSLFRKMFGSTPAPPSVPAYTHFRDSESEDESASRSAPRREVVHIVLRETMRRHGIPSAWIECRILTVVSRNRGGMHATLIVKGGQERLLAYVPAFQASFRDALQKFDPRAPEWLLSLSWQFEGFGANAGMPMPDPKTWSAPERPAAAVSEEDDLKKDLEALFAIRDAALRAEPPPTDFQPTQPSGGEMPR